MISEEGERAVLLTLLFVLVLRRIEIGHSACVFEQMDRQTKKEQNIERFTLTLTFAVLLHLS